MLASLRSPTRHHRAAWAPTAALLLTLGCIGGTEPSTNPADLRVDPRATATLWGYVHVDAAGGLPRRQRQGGFRERARGVTVELVRWEWPVIDPSHPADARDTLGSPRVRMIVIARTQTDESGRYRFTHVPRYEEVSVLVEGSMPDYEVMGRYEAATPTPVMWLAHPPERREDLPIWDLSR